MIQISDEMSVKWENDIAHADAHLERCIERLRAVPEDAHALDIFTARDAVNKACIRLMKLKTAYNLYLLEVQCYEGDVEECVEEVRRMLKREDLVEEESRG